MLKICGFDNNTIAERSGLRKDDVITAFNGEKAEDMLDVAYYDSEERFSVTVNRDGRELTFRVSKSPSEQMGWNFYDECYITPRWCANKCVFCFVDQLPEGQRKTLYVKDDDWRLSFVSGNYVTLTNVSDKEIDRIISKKFGPLYISVHAADDVLRRKLLGNPQARSIMPLLKTLADGGITMYAQIVLCPDLNDGVNLEKTLNALYSLFPAVKSVAVVPVGLTKHREELTELRSFDEAAACSAVDITEKFDALCFRSHGEHFAYCSDEMYIYARRDLPPYEYYGDFGQLENGVGLIADLRCQFDLALGDAFAASEGSFTIVTGVSAEPYLKELIDRAKNKFPDLKANVTAVVNRFFGESVTVAGLLTGRDIADALKDRTDTGETVLLPRVMLKETEDVFLDGMTLTELENILGKKIKITADGYELCRAVLECD